MKTLRPYEIALRAGLDRSVVSRILSRERCPTPETARRLEMATGVPRVAWIWPDEYYNPYFKQAQE